MPRPKAISSSPAKLPSLAAEIFLSNQGTPYCRYLAFTPTTLSL
jgi:hypothetical protein